MNCVACVGAAISERPERTAQGYRRFRCRDCGKQFNERTGGSLNRTQYPSDVIALVVFWRLRYKLSLRDLPEMFLLRGIEFTYEAVRDWEAKLTPLLIDNLRRRRGFCRCHDELRNLLHTNYHLRQTSLPATRRRRFLQGSRIALIMMASS
jgi:hypothetical protein